MMASTILVAKAVRRISRAIVNGILPPRCLACGEIEAAAPKRHEFGIDRDSHAPVATQEGNARIGGDDPLGSRPLFECAGQRACVRAEIKGDAKSSPDVAEPVDQPAGGNGMQKIDAPAARRALAMQPPRPTVEQRCGFCRDLSHRGLCCGR